MSTRIKEAINPKTNQLIKEGDVVVIYQGRFGHDNIMTIKSIWNHGDWIGVSENEDKCSTHIEAIKEVLTTKKLKQIQRDISRLQYVEKYKFC